MQPLFCSYCGAEIPEKVLQARHYNPRALPERLYCNRQCQASGLKQAGHYQRVAALGNAAQKAYKAEHGVVPGYERRRAALSRPDRPNNRHRRKETQ